MNTLIRRLAIAAVAIAAVAALAFPAAAAFWGETVKGNGQFRTESRAITGFSGVAVSVPAQVEVRQGATEGLTLEADGNLLPLVETKVENGVLEIRAARRNLSLEPQKLRIVVDLKTANQLSIGGSGSITAAALKSRKLDLSIGGSGKIEVAKVEADALETAIGGSGKIVLGGTARRLAVAIGGSGDVVADKLAADTAEVSIGGSGNVTLWVRTRLEIAIGGSGNVSYWGDPQLESASVGSGRIRRLGAAPV